jgi:radical SAM-linked protein
VCNSFGVKKIYDKPYIASDIAQKNVVTEHLDPSICPRNLKETYRYRIKLTKTGVLKYFSHLDWQNTFYKAISRSDLEVGYSHGFNPTMKVSMGIALPLFFESVSELVDIEFTKQYGIGYIKAELNRVLPKESRILSVEEIDKSEVAIDRKVCWAEYKIELFDNDIDKYNKLVYNTERVLSQDEILVERKNKKGLVKTTNIKQSIGSHRFENGCLFIVLKTGQGDEIPSLRADILMDIIAPNQLLKIIRTKFLTESLHEL